MRTTSSSRTHSGGADAPAAHLPMTAVDQGLGGTMSTCAPPCCEALVGSFEVRFQLVSVLGRARLLHHATGKNGEALPTGVPQDHVGVELLNRPRLHGRIALGASRRPIQPLAFVVDLMGPVTLHPPNVSGNADQPRAPASHWIAGISSSGTQSPTTGASVVVDPSSSTSVAVGSGSAMHDVAREVLVTMMMTMAAMATGTMRPSRRGVRAG